MTGAPDIGLEDVVCLEEWGWLIITDFSSCF